VLWRPSPVLDQAIDVAEACALAARGATSEHSKEHHHHHGEGKEGEHKEHHHNNKSSKVIDAALAAVDIACGSGRDAVFLALRGWRVTVSTHPVIPLPPPTPEMNPQVVFLY